MAALARVAQLVGLSSRNQKVAGSIPGQGAYLGSRFNSQTRMRGSQLMFSSLPPSFSKSKEKMSLGEDKKKIGG